jgi:hypothetical protein
MYVWVWLRPHTDTKCGLRSPPQYQIFYTGSPVKGPSPPPPKPLPRSLFRERYSIPRAPFIHLSKSPVDQPSTRFPKRGPYGKRCPSPEPFLPILQGPQQGSPPSRFPSQSSTERETLHLQSPFQPHLKVPSRWAHSRLPNWAPMKRDAHPQSLPFLTVRALSKACCLLKHHYFDCSDKAAVWTAEELFVVRHK